MGSRVWGPLWPYQSVQSKYQTSQPAHAHPLQRQDSTTAQQQQHSKAKHSTHNTAQRGTLLVQQQQQQQQAVVVKLLSVRLVLVLF